MMLQRSHCRKRSLDLTRDSGLNSQDTDDARHIQEVLDALRQRVWLFWNDASTLGFPVS